jgi:hypothetical protein
MRKTIVIITLFISINIFSQNNNSINLSEIKFCELSIDDLKLKDSELKEVKLEEMDLCPDGYYVDLKTLKAADVLKKYDSLETWTSRGCSNYWGINKDNKLNFYVKINKDKKPQYPVDEKYYAEQDIEAIDIISDCYAFFEKVKINPLYIIDGKEITEEDIIRNLKPEDVDSITVLKDKGAVEKYGDKGKNGVIEIYLKKKK